jgi:hypothetical protein
VLHSTPIIFFFFLFSSLTYQMLQACHSELSRVVPIHSIQSSHFRHQLPRVSNKTWSFGVIAIRSKPASGQSRHICKVFRRLYCSRVKLPEHEAEYSPPCSAGMKHKLYLHTNVRCNSAVNIRWVITACDFKKARKWILFWARQTQFKRSYFTY